MYSIQFEFFEFFEFCHNFVCAPITRWFSIKLLQRNLEKHTSSLGLQNSEYVRICCQASITVRLVTS